MKVAVIGSPGKVVSKLAIERLLLQGHTVQLVSSIEEAENCEVICGLSAESMQIKDYQFKLLKSEPYKEPLTGRQKRVNRRKKNRKRR